ncbi:MAG: PhoH family protein [Planctomycetota bacterium]|nr:PhoH family protein [Planctomycetota bacterium]
MELTVTLEQPERSSVLFGPADEHLKTIRHVMGVQMFARGGVVRITGAARGVSGAAAVLAALQRRMRHNKPIGAREVADALAEVSAGVDSSDTSESITVYNGQAVHPRSPGQRRYVEAIRKHDMVFCTGPAGTGKTYLAVAMAVHMLKAERAKRMVLARPAVEAGEKLGFLPGDMQAKVNPYLRPLFDALHDMMDFEQSRRFMANDIIEVIPLAFMRGRTLNDSVIILDEAQNTTPAQMLMFLTRMGHGSKMIITGDDSQIDLPENTTSGLIDSARRLKGIKGLIFIRLDRHDIVRHRLVQNIVDAYGENSNR